MTEPLLCPHCQKIVSPYRNPVPTVDIIIQSQDESGAPALVLIKRKNPPFGWALPGGFVDYGESLEDAAMREAREETGLEITLVGQFRAYSRPDRDPRHHTITNVFIATGTGDLQGRDDAAEAGIFSEKNLPAPLAFDHAQILEDYFRLTKM